MLSTRPEFRNKTHLTGHSRFPVMTKEFYLEYSDGFYKKVIDQLAEYKNSGKEMRYFGAMNIEY